MLKIIDSFVPDKTYLDIDDYVPFTFNCVDSHPDFMPLYWCLSNAYSLIEIGMNPDNGNLASITVTCFKEYEKNTLLWKNPSAKIVEGMPIFETSEWPRTDEFRDNFRTENYPLKGIIGDDFASFTLFEETKIHSYYIHKNVCLGVDADNNLRKIEFFNLSKEDIKRIIPPKRIDSSLRGKITTFLKSLWHNPLR